MINIKFDLLIMKRVLISAALLMLSVIAMAQEEKLTLRQSVETAISNNLQVKQSDLQRETEHYYLKQSKAGVLPDLSANLNNGTSQGRSIDPFTNGYINQQVNTANFNLNAGVTVFNGGRIRNTIKQRELGYEASKMELQQVKDNITLNVIMAYVQILNNEDQLRQAKKQEQVTSAQVARLEILNEDGAISPSDLYDLKGQLSNDQLSIINIQNTLNAAKLMLVQYMNIPYNKNLQVEEISAEQFTAYAASPDEIYQVALKQLSIVKGATLRRRSAEKAVSVARSLYYPTVGFYGNLFTNYSSAARKDILLNTTQVTSGDYIELAGSKVPVYTSQRNFNAEKINYFNQFNNNYSTSVSIGLSIPLLNGFRARYQAGLAKTVLQNAAYVEETTTIQLRQSVEQAYFNMTAAYDRYQKLLVQVADYSALFHTAEVKFNAGASTQVDYLIAKNKVDLANTNFIIARYDYLVRIKVLDYYQGKMLW